MTTTAGEPATVPVPEPSLTPEQMVARARSLRPLLLESQADTEERGTYSPEIHEKFREAGFYRVLQPRRFGGYEFDVPTYFRVIIELGRGDPGAAWCAALASAHALPVAAHYEASAQEEFFGRDGEFAAAHSATARGTATVVDGGYVIDGDWAYSSGIPYSTHFLGTATVIGGPPGLSPEVVFVLPREKYEILDDWGGDQTLGMRGSGSNTVRVRRVRIPSGHAVPWNWLGGEVSPEGTPGTKLHGNPMYLGQVGALYSGELGAAQVGAARAAVDEFERLLRTRKTQFPPIRLRALDPAHQETLGLAMSWTDAAEGALLNAGQIYMEQCARWAETGIGPSPAETLRLAGTIQTSQRLAWEVVQLVYSWAGSSVTRRGQRMQKYFRDLAMVQPQRVDATAMVTKRIAQHHLGVDGDRLRDQALRFSGRSRRRRRGARFP